MKHNILAILKQQAEKNVTGLPIKQASLQLDISIHQIIFVKDFVDYDPVFNYSDLSSPSLSTEDQAVFTQACKQYDLEAVEAKQKGEKAKYNGDNLLLEGLALDDGDDDNDGVVYIKAYKIGYWFLRAMQDKLFPKHSEVYKLDYYAMSVYVPMITKEVATYFMERADLATQFFSMAAGHIEAKKEKPSLTGLVSRTAKEELLEEILGEEGSKKPRSDYYSPGLRGFNFVEGIHNNRKYKVIDFILPNFVDCVNSFMRFILENNRAKDAKEHTQKYFEVMLTRDELSKTFDLKKDKAGMTYHDCTKDQKTSQHKL